MTAPMPMFRTLTDRDARALLARHSVGRIAFSLHDRVDIEPIHFAADGDWIFGRTSAGSKLASLSHNPWCAFEVDEVRSPFEWMSVVVKGSFHLLDPQSGSTDTYRCALGSLRKLVAATFTAQDPAPHRTFVFGIHVNEIFGRAARHGPG